MRQTMLIQLQPHRRGSSADRRQTLPHDRNLSQKKQKIPKIWGLSHKKYWAKTCKILVNFLQRPTLIANISGTAYIQIVIANFSRPIPPAF